MTPPAGTAPVATLPTGAEIQVAVDAAHARWKDDDSGANADYIPYLAEVPSELFGVAVVTVDGDIYVAGDVDYGFSIQSVSKPFVAALVMQEAGPEVIAEKIGIEPTGLPFNSVTAIERHDTRAVNPLVNAGAMAVVSLVEAEDPEERFARISRYLDRMAGSKLEFNQEVYESEAATNARNQSIARLLHSYDRLYCDPAEACDVYTRQCSINVTSKQLAVMGATLANGGINPLTGERVLDGKHVPRLLAVMMMAGFYDEAGLWAWHAGVPAKTGVGGGIVAVVPGKMAIVGFSPRVDDHGNSHRGARAIFSVVDALGLNLFGTGK